MQTQRFIVAGRGVARMQNLVSTCFWNWHLVVCSNRGTLWLDIATSCPTNWNSRPRRSRQDDLPTYECPDRALERRTWFRYYCDPRNEFKTLIYSCANQQSYISRYRRLYVASWSDILLFKANRCPFEQKSYSLVQLTPPLRRVVDTLSWRSVSCCWTHIILLD